MWGSMDEEVKTTYGKSYFDQKVKTDIDETMQLLNLLFKVAIMKSYMTGGITDISPVINSYTDALLDVFPQVHVVVDTEAYVFMCSNLNLCAYFCTAQSLRSV